MEEDKAASYYDELTRKGEGAARFKQGLGYSSGESTFQASSHSSLSNFVKATNTDKFLEDSKQKQLRIESIHNKLNRNSDSRLREGDRLENRRRSRSRERSERRGSHNRSRSRERIERRHNRNRSQSRERSQRRGRAESRDRSRSRERHYQRERHSHSRERSDHRRERRSRSLSPRAERERKNGETSGDMCRAKSKNHDAKGSWVTSKHSNSSKNVDYSKLINGYEKMTPAERVKAKMKLQLSQTVVTDAAKGMSSEWERFDFDKDAPLDGDDVEVEAGGGDDAGLDTGRNFRFAAMEANREAQIEAAHDQAIFGAPVGSAALSDERSPAPTDEDRSDTKGNGFAENIISERVFAMQQGSWRDRARKVQQGPKDL
ncbi:hypothetical protein AMTRI_Chr10g4870 [Amborella trichopoda]